METNQNSPKTRTWLYIIIALVVLGFFVYSYQSIMTTESRFGDQYITHRNKHLIRVLNALAHPDLSDRENNQYVLMKMLETIQMAFLATIFSGLFASLLTFIISLPSSRLGKVLMAILQLFLAAIRSIHPLVTVIFVIISTGIRAKSGVIALTIFSTAILLRGIQNYAQENTSISKPFSIRSLYRL